MCKRARACANISREINGFLTVSGTADYSLRHWNAWLARSFPPAALGKAYEHHVGKALPTCSIDSIIIPYMAQKEANMT